MVRGLGQGYKANSQVVPMKILKAGGQITGA